jgi:hypothetical protein
MNVNLIITLVTEMQNVLIFREVTDVNVYRDIKEMVPIVNVSYFTIDVLNILD